MGGLNIEKKEKGYSNILFDQKWLHFYNFGWSQSLKNKYGYEKNKNPIWPERGFVKVGRVEVKKKKEGYDQE